MTVEHEMSKSDSAEKLQAEEESDHAEEAMDEIGEELDSEKKRKLETVLRRMSSTQNNESHSSYEPIRRGRRRAVSTSDHKTCALVQTRLKFGDIM